MTDQAQGRPARFLLVLIPLAMMLVSFVWIASLDPLRNFNNGAPAVEALTVERTVLDDTGLKLQLRAVGSEPLVIAQVQVDDAYWTFIQDPPGPIARGNTAWIHVAYPWVMGEAHIVAFVTSTACCPRIRLPSPCQPQPPMQTSCDRKPWSVRLSGCCRSHWG